MLKKALLLLTQLAISGCYTTYIQPENVETATMKIVNDSVDMDIILNTYADGASCKDEQIFNIPKDMQVPENNVNSLLKAKGVFITTINANKPFSLRLQGTFRAGHRVTACTILTTLNPSTNASYEYHYNYSKETDKCHVYLQTVANSNIKKTISQPQFISRKIRQSTSSDGSNCI